MSDVREAEGNEGNSGFASEWQRLAREDDGQAPAPQDSETLRDDLGDEAEGQGESSPGNEAAPQEPATSENTDDIWANAPEHFRKAFEAERAAREKAENVIRSNNGRLSKAEREAAALRAQLVAQPQREAPQQQLEADDTVPEHLRAVREEYQEVAGPLVDEIVALRQTVARLDASSATAQQAETARHQLELAEFLAGEEQKLGEAHSDWREVVVEPEFVQWVQNGPQFIRDGIARNGNGIVDAEEATEILNLFKERTGRNSPDQLAERRRRQLEGGRTVPARSIGATPSGGPDNFSSEWARLREQERREAQRR